MSTCPSENSLIRLLEKDLDPRVRQAVHAHIRVCERCFATVADMAASAELSSDGDADPRSVSLEHAALEMGSLFKDRFELLRSLGTGCFGHVFLALDTQNRHRKVAIKILKPQFVDQPEVQWRFKQEGASLELLSHKNIVRVYERGQWHGFDYIVTEYVDGFSLAQWLADHREQGQRPPWHEVVDLFGQICEAVAFAHGLRTVHGIIHRDLKPRNIMVTPREDGLHVTVLDFGLARLGERSETLSAEAIGTPGYMAPEQMGSQSEVGPWTDVYALGVILLEMLTLKNRTADDRSFWSSVMRDPKDLLRQLRRQCPDVPIALLRVAIGAIPPQISDRYQDGSALLAALRSAQRQRSSSVSRKTLLRTGFLATLLVINVSQCQSLVESQSEQRLLPRWSQVVQFVQDNLDGSSLYFHVGNSDKRSQITLFPIPQHTEYVRVTVRHGRRIHEEDIPLADFHGFRRHEILIPDLDPHGEITVHAIAFGKHHHLAESSARDPLQLGSTALLIFKECVGGFCRRPVLDGASDEEHHYNAVWCDRYNMFAGGSNLPIRGDNRTDRFEWSYRDRASDYVMQFFGSSIQDLYAIGGCPLDGTNCPYSPEAGRNRLAKWNPARRAWEPVPVPEVAGRFWFAYPAADGALWIVGQTKTGNSLIVHRTPQGRWEVLPDSSALGARLQDIWQASPTSVWAVGAAAQGRGVLLHKNGDAPFVALDDPPTQHPLSALWGSSERDLWVGTNDGFLFHRDGAEWQQAACASIEKGTRINILLGRSAHDIWAAGGPGFLAHYDGSCWNRTDINLDALAGSGKTHLNGMFLNGENVCVISGSGDVFQYRYAARQSRPILSER